MKNNFLKNNSGVKYSKTGKIVSILVLSAVMSGSAFALSACAQTSSTSSTDTA